MHRVLRSGAALRVAGRRAVVDVVDDYDQYQAIKKDHPKVVLCFGAEWCPPCKAAAPQYNAMSDANSELKFLKVDVDDNGEIASDHNVSSIPHYETIQNGKTVEKLVGADMNKLQGMVEKLKDM